MSAVRRFYYKLRKQCWHRKVLSLFFQCCNWNEVVIKECFFTFTIKFLFLFLFLVRVWWAHLKRLNVIRFVRFSQKFFWSSEFHTTVLERNLATVVAGSLTDWISVVTINWPAQAKFLFKALNNLKFTEYAVKILYCNTHISGCFIILSFKRLSTLNTVWSLKFSNDFYIINIVPLNNVHKQNTNHNDCQNSIFVQKRDNL